MFYIIASNDKETLLVWDGERFVKLQWSMKFGPKPYIKEGNALRQARKISYKVKCCQIINFNPYDKKYNS